MNISLSKSAYDCLDNITDFTSNISLNYSNKVISTIYSSISILEYIPYCGKVIPEFMDMHFRELICSGYRIMYFISKKENSIIIRYILSTRQNRTQFVNVHKNEINDFIKFLNQIF